MAGYPSKVGDTYIKDGRVFIKVKAHPVFGTGWVRRSHVVWFDNTGYKPDWKNKREIVHHRDDDKQNDVFDNLELMTQAKHLELHAPRLGVKDSEATKAKLSSARLGNQNRTGVAHDDLSKKKISEGLKKSWTKPERRAYIDGRQRDTQGKLK